MASPVIRSALEKGFVSVDSGKIEQDIFSWTVLSQNELLKHFDKSAVIYSGTAIPKELVPFFGLDMPNPPKALSIVSEGVVFSIRVEKDSLGRVRIFWPKELSGVIEKRFPEQCEKIKQGKASAKYELVMKISKGAGEPFNISFFSLLENPETFLPEEYVGKYEGRLVESNYQRRIRSAENRKMAIEKHGKKCFVCGFNFEQTYGELGKDFIEIHHLIPLCETTEEILINPEKDLIPLCANCHRMIHRLGTEMSLDELKSIWSSQQTRNH